MSLTNKIYSNILEIRHTSLRKRKEKLMQEMKGSPTYKRIMFLTYSPYHRFHIRKIPNSVMGQGTDEFSSETWLLLHQLSLRKLTGTAARESLFEHIESLTPSGGEILKLIVKKDLKCGIAVTTINKVFPELIPVFECQLVDDWVDDKAKFPMMVGLKVDGVRGEYRAGSLYTRRGHKVTGVDHILKYLRFLDSAITLSGELYIPGMNFHRSSGIIRSNKPTKKQVQFAIFDIPYLDTMPFDKRHDYLSRTFYPIGTKPPPEAVYIPHMVVDTLDEVTNFFNAWCKRGFEGLVGKNPSGFVKMGKGSHDWMRLVKGISEEYRIIEVYESEEMPNHLGGIIIKGQQVNIKVGSGFTKDERLKYWRNPSIIIGKFATIISKEKTQSGSLRQPIFKGIRWDISC